MSWLKWEPWFLLSVRHCLSFIYSKIVNIQPYTLSLACIYNFQSLPCTTEPWFRKVPNAKKIFAILKQLISAWEPMYISYSGGPTEISRISKLLNLFFTTIHDPSGSSWNDHQQKYEAFIIGFHRWVLLARFWDSNFNSLLWSRTARGARIAQEAGGLGIFPI